MVCLFSDVKSSFTLWYLIELSNAHLECQAKDEGKDVGTTMLQPKVEQAQNLA